VLLMVVIYPERGEKRYWWTTSNPPPLPTPPYFGPYKYSESWMGSSMGGGGGISAAGWLSVPYSGPLRSSLGHVRGNGGIPEARSRSRRSNSASSSAGGGNGGPMAEAFLNNPRGKGADGALSAEKADGRAN